MQLRCKLISWMAASCLLWSCVWGQNCSLEDVSSCQVFPLVATKFGPLQGFNRQVEGQDVSSFLGIPFAEPPVGRLRFKYPVPYTKVWNGTRPATQASMICPQPLQRSHSSTGRDVVDEDCLYLNIFTPYKALSVSKPLNQSVPLPVMFWIYGGGYTIGDAYFQLPTGGWLYDGARLAGRHDVIVVTSNYRLNVLGFNMFVRGEHGETGTQAMADQRLAMIWTHSNVQSFGGDPSKVTIFGESAGAFSVIYHLVSPISWPYFSKAIIQSGTSELSWFFQPRDLAADLFKGWAAAVGCPESIVQLECLQAKPVDAFVEAPRNYTGRSPAYPLFTVGPVVDGSEHGLLENPRKLIEAGKFAKVPLLIGSNKDGGSLFEPLLAGVIPHVHFEAFDKADVQTILSWAFNRENTTAINKSYDPAHYSSLHALKYQKLVARAMRDFGFMCSNRRLVSAWRAHGLAAYLYTFSFDFGGLEKITTLGDFHGSDTIFVFRADLWIPELLPFRADVQRMSDIMTCQWTSFAYSGDPNGGNSVAPPNCLTVHGVVDHWPMFDSDRKYYSLQATKSIGPKVAALRADNDFPDDEFASDAKCDMWDTVVYPWHDAGYPYRGSSTSIFI